MPLRLKVASIRALSVVAIALVSACSSAAPNDDASPSGASSQSGITATGFIAVRSKGLDAEERFDGGPCTALSGYEDIAQGADVVVRDSEGKTVALGALRGGSLTGVEQVDIFCRFGFAIPDIPAGQGFYTFEVGNREPKQLTESELGSPLMLQLGE